LYEGIYDTSTSPWTFPDLLAESPYEFNLNKPSGADAPFTVAELEKVLRYYDFDSSTLHSRLTDLNNLGFLRNNANYRRAVTTDSWDIPVPGVVCPDSYASSYSLSNAQTIMELLAARLPSTWSATVRDAQISKMLSPDLVMGLRMDINRPIGNGRDDNGNAVVDDASRDFNVDVRSAGDLNGENLHALVETPPMLAERRLVVVRGLEQWRRNAKVWQVLRRYLEHPSPTTVLVLTHGAAQDPDAGLVSDTTHVVLDGLKPNQIRSWLGKRAKRANLELEDDAAEHLVTALGGDLAQLAVEIEKLVAAAPGDRPLTVGDVAALVGVRRGETVHDWVDAVLAHDTPRAIALVDVVLGQAGVTAVQMVTSIGTALIGVRLARALIDQGAASREVERRVYQAIRAARPPKVRKWDREAANWSAAARRWSAEDLDAATAVAYDADLQLKSTTGDYYFRSELNQGRFLGFPRAGGPQYPGNNGRGHLLPDAEASSQDEQVT